MTEQECLNYARKHLRDGIQDICVITCEPNDSARDEAITNYVYMEERVFDANGLEYNEMDTILTCKWTRYGLLFSQDSINRYFHQTDKAKTLDESLRAYKPLSVSDSGKKYDATVILGLSPDNKGQNLTPEDINLLYDAWEGRCRIIVVMTNPLDTWGLPHGKRVKYKITPLQRENHSTTAIIAFSFPQQARAKDK